MDVKRLRSSNLLLITMVVFRLMEWSSVGCDSPGQLLIGKKTCVFAEEEITEWLKALMVRPGNKLYG